MINGCRNLDDLPNRSRPPCYLQQGRVYTNQLNPDTSRDFAGALRWNVLAECEQRLVRVIPELDAYVASATKGFWT